MERVFHKHKDLFLSFIGAVDFLLKGITICIIIIIMSCWQQRPSVTGPTEDRGTHNFHKYNENWELGEQV